MNNMKPDEDELETNSRIIAILKSEVSVHDSFHGTLSSTLAEERLKNAKEARCYLTRISDKKGCLILSYRVSQNVVKHLLVPKDIDDISNFISTFDNCEVLVKPPVEFEKEESPKDENIKFSTSISTETAYVCFVCGWRSEDKYNRHINVHRVIKCINCQKYILANSIADHKKTCLYKDTLVKKQCKLCNFSSHFNSNLKKHMINHKIRPYKCKMCMRKYCETEQELKKHQQFHCQTIACEFCDKQFSSNGSLYRHLRTVHKENGRKRKVGKTIHICPEKECNGKKFSNRSRLNKHISRHNTPKSGAIIFTCDDCGKKYHRKDRFKRHQANNHAESAEFVFFL